MKQVIVELQYFPSTYWFALFFAADKVIIDDREHFRKQTFRNRTVILSANKPLHLVMPVHKGKSKIPVTNVTVDYSEDWQRSHWQALRSAYNSAPYFDFYSTEIEPVFKEQHNLLFKRNMAILEKLQELIPFMFLDKIEFLSESNNTDKAMDWRGAIRPKKGAEKPEAFFKPVNYPQVFRERFGFIPGLSILDLLFNTGPACEKILLKMASDRA